MLSPDVGATDPGPPEVENFTCHFFVIYIYSFFLFSRKWLDSCDAKGNGQAPHLSKAGGLWLLSEQ